MFPDPTIAAVSLAMALLCPIDGGPEEGPAFL